MNGFTLRGIDYSEFLKEYRNGTLKVVRPGKIELSKPIQTERVAGTNSGEPFYEYRHNNQIYRVHTTNNIIEGNQLRCRNCGRPIEEQSCGIPYRMTQKREEKKILTRVSTDGCYCSESCMYRSYLLTKKNLPLFRNSDYIIGYLHQLAHPGKPLVAAPDPDQLIERGGTMTDEEYDNNLTPWVLSNNTLVIPTRLQYVNKAQ